jgi:hypothetical protein
MEAALNVESLEDAVDMAIAACDGDLRDTIRSLMVANSFLLEEVERCRSLVSSGFVRGRLSLYDLP